MMGSDSNRSAQDTFTPTQFRKLQAENPSKFMYIYDNNILNLSNWVNCHPGGELVLQHFKGQDITDHILASHPPSVLKLIPKFIVGKLIDAPDTNYASLQWRALNTHLTDQGFYETDYKFYALEFIKICVLFSTLVYTTINGYWIVGALVCSGMWHQIAFIAHDAGHNGITHIRSIDQKIGILLGNLLGGISIGWWKASHNIHHLLTNHIHHDPDIQHLPFFAVDGRFFKSIWSSFHQKFLKYDQLAKLLIPFQHNLFYLVMFFGRFNLILQSFMHLIPLLSQKPRQKANDNAGFELTCLVLFWCWFSYLLSHLNNVWEVIGFVLLSHGGTLLLHVQITISHFGMPCDEERMFGDNGEKECTDQESEIIDSLIPTSQHHVITPFPIRNLRSSMDVDCPTFLDWFHGGLQYQVTHHLFPRLPRHRLRFVRENYTMKFARDIGVEYHHYEFLESNWKVLGGLQRVAELAKVYAQVASGVYGKNSKKDD